MKNIVIVVGVMLILALVVGLYWKKINYGEQTNPLSSLSPNNQITSIAENLDTPWAIVFLPDNTILVAERPGRVRLIGNNGQLTSQPLATLNQVQEIGEGGLLGITLHPNFSSNHYIYLYYTYGSEERNTLNRVVRMIYEDNRLKDEQIIVNKIPGASNHNGGRIKFGPDGYLYITTGDAENPSQSQDTNSLGGKILRVTDEGKAVPDNPFGNLVYSYGHRNPQGLAWDNQRQLWATEHGPSGIPSGLDELNLIEKGKNYGWPVIQGDQTREGMETPKLNSGSTTWAPAGAVFVGNSLFFGGLRGQTLYEAVITGKQINLKQHFKGEFGRIREVTLGPDNLLYITTSNQDGRGIPKPADDKLIRLNLSG